MKKPFFNQVERIHGRSYFTVRIAPLLLAIATSSGFLPTASATSLAPIGEFVPGYMTSTRTKDMPTADFDGDGLPDVIIVGSKSYSDLIQVAGFQSGQGWKVKQLIIPSPGSYLYGTTNLAAWQATDGPHLLYIRGDLTSEYSGWRLTLVRQLQLPGSPEFSDVQVADVDNNGTFELLAASSYAQGIRAISLVTGGTLWETSDPNGYNTTLHVAQLDADPALEIIVSGMPGRVIDGATHAIEWQYKDGFGPLIEHGRFGGSSPRFASLSDRILMFQSQPWSPLWDANEYYVSASTVVDADGDNIDELVCNTNSFPGGIRVFDVQTQTTRSSFAGSDAWQIAATDFDGDPQKEIALGLTVDSFASSGSSFRVINATSGTSEFEIPATAPGPYLVGGFIQDGATVDTVFGSGGESRYAGVFARADSITGAVRWQTAANDSLLDMSQVNNILIANLAGYAHPTILASGSGLYSYQKRIVALDADDGSVLWHIDSENSALPQYAAINAVTAVDTNGDSTADAVLACTSEPRLRLFDAATRAQIWASVTMSDNCGGAMQLTSGGNKQLVAVLSEALRAYDAQTHLLSWSLPFPSGIFGASYLEHGAAGAELAVFSEYGITFFDVETRNQLRELVLPDLYPIQAVAQAAGVSIRDLVVAGNGKLVVLDGITGAVKATSAALGLNAGLNNQVALRANPDGSVLVGLGSDVAVFSHRLDGLSDEIFTDGFDPGMP